MNEAAEKVEAGPTGEAAARRPRDFGYAILLCLAGAGLALLAATRTWTVEVTVRLAPLPVQHTDRTGGALLPWLPPLALVGLAGAGALIATRGNVRRALGVLLLLLGLGLAAGGGYGVFDATDAGVSGARVAWPVLCALGGLLLAAGGVSALLRGHRWPGMGARYERPVRGAGHQRADRPTAGIPPKKAGSGSVTSTQAWDALDRGEDPFDPA
jgi:uncharacterized membrane protein (TIGR02234 family)